MPAARTTLPAGVLAGISLLLAASALAPARASSGGADLLSRIGDAQSREQALRGSIQADSNRIAGFQGRISDLRARLRTIEASLASERAQLNSIRSQLRAARARLVFLRGQLARDQQVLSTQLVAQYEAPQPGLATVVLSARGFADLLERVDDLKRLARRNAQTIVDIRTERATLGVEAQQLAATEVRQQQVTQATQVQRNEVARLHLAVLTRELQFARARREKRSKLAGLRSRERRLEHQLAATQPALAGGVLGIGGAGFSSQGGGGGFSPAAGTNYSVGEEPQIASRLDALGRALGMHLIGISGYRSPQHSVEVGGFANDPHTQGRASDTPGVEGVPEATLERFGLTRPFPGAAEADHIQLLGG